MDHLAQATTDHNMQYVIKSTRRAGSTHGNYTATAKLKPPLNGHVTEAQQTGQRRGDELAEALPGQICSGHPVLHPP
jgi:hypothetical protein